MVGRFNADGTPDTSFSEDGFAEVDLGPGVEQSLAVAPLANGDVVAAVNAIEEDGGISIFLVQLRCQRPAGHRRAWGGETGAVEVVFGWANANNDAFPGVENPPQDTAWDLKVDNSSGTEKLVVAGHGSAADGSGRTDADRYVVRLLAADGSVDPAFNGGKPFTYHSAQAFNEGGRRVIVEADGAIAQRRLHQPRRYAAQPRDPDPAQSRWHARSEVRRLRHAAVVGRRGRPRGDARALPCSTPSSPTAALPKCYAAAKLSDGSYVTTGYGGATAEGTASTLGFKTTEAPDIVSFKVVGTALDTTYGQDGQAAIQSEGLGLPTAEDRGRNVVGAPGRPHAARRLLRRRAGGDRPRRRGPARHHGQRRRHHRAAERHGRPRSSSAPRSRPTASTSRSRPTTTRPAPAS